MARPTDWSALGLDADPTPGDPAGLQGVLSLLNDIAQSTGTIEQTLQDILGTADSGNWEGLTAQALKGQISGRFIHFMSAASTSFNTAYTAANTFSGALDTYQNIADTALSKAQAATPPAPPPPPPDPMIGPLPKPIPTITDPQILAWQQQATQAGTDLLAAAQSAAGTISSVAHGVEPISGWQEFWEALGWIALLLMLPAIIFGGFFAIIAFALNMILFIHAAVQYADGQISFGQLFLSFLGIIAPTTEGLDLAALIPSLARGIGDAVDDVVGFLRMGFSDFMNLARGFNFTDIFTVDTLLAIGRFVYTGTVWTMNGIKALPTLIADGSLAAGKFATDILTDVGRTAISDFKTGAWVRLFLPLKGTEISGVGFAGAFRLGILERGFGITAAPSLNLRLVASGLRVTDAGTHLSSLSSADYFRANPLTMRIDTPGTLSVARFDTGGMAGLTGATPAMHLNLGAMSTDSLALRPGDLGFAGPTGAGGLGGGLGRSGFLDLGGLRFNDTALNPASGFNSIHLTLDHFGNTALANRADGFGTSVFDLRNPVEISNVHLGTSQVVHMDDFSMVIRNSDAVPSAHLPGLGENGVSLGGGTNLGGATRLDLGRVPEFNPAEGALANPAAAHVPVLKSLADPDLGLGPAMGAGAHPFPVAASTSASVDVRMGNSLGDTFGQKALNLVDSMDRPAMPTFEHSITVTTNDLHSDTRSIVSTDSTTTTPTSIDTPKSAPSTAVSSAESLAQLRPEDLAPGRAGVPGVLGLPGDRVAVHWTGTKPDLFGGPGVEHGQLTPAPTPAGRGDLAHDARIGLLHEYTDRLDYEHHLAGALDNTWNQHYEAEMEREILRQRAGLGADVSEEGHEAVFKSYESDLKTAFTDTHGGGADWHPGPQAQTAFANRAADLERGLPAQFDRRAAFEQTVGDARLHLASAEYRETGVDLAQARSELFGGAAHEPRPVTAPRERDWVGDPFSEADGALGEDGIFRLHQQEPDPVPAADAATVAIRAGESPHWAALHEDLAKAFEELRSRPDFDTAWAQRVGTVYRDLDTRLTWAGREEDALDGVRGLLGHRIEQVHADLPADVHARVADKFLSQAREEFQQVRLQAERFDNLDAADQSAMYDRGEHPDLTAMWHNRLESLDDEIGLHYFREATQYHAGLEFDAKAAGWSAGYRDAGHEVPLNDQALAEARERFQTQVMAELDRTSGLTGDIRDFNAWYAIRSQTLPRWLDHEVSFQRELDRAEDDFDEAAAGYSRGGSVTEHGWDTVVHEYKDDLREAFFGSRMIDAHGLHDAGDVDEHLADDALTSFRRSDVPKALGKVEERFLVESILERALRSGADDFHALGQEFRLPEERYQALADEYRTDLATRLHEVYQPERDASAWLTEEHANGDLFGTKLDDLRTVADEPRIAAPEPVVSTIDEGAGHAVVQTADGDHVLTAAPTPIRKAEPTPPPADPIKLEQDALSLVQHEPHAELATVPEPTRPLLAEALPPKTTEVTDATDVAKAPETVKVPETVTTPETMAQGEDIAISGNGTPPSGPADTFATLLAPPSQSPHLAPRKVVAPAEEDQAPLLAAQDQIPQIIGTPPAEDQFPAPDLQGLALALLKGMDDPMPAHLVPSDVSTPLLSAEVRTIPGSAPAVWFKAPRDTVSVARAANAVPRAVGWTSVIAHNQGGSIVDGDTRLDGAALATKLGSAERVILNVCEAVEDNLAADLHAASGNGTIVLAPTGKAMVSADGDVLSGTWFAAEDHKVVPLPVGDWVLWQNGAARSMGTPSLVEALAKLDAEIVSGGPPPQEAIGFFYDLSAPQTATLNQFHYAVAAPGGITAGFTESDDSFFDALLTLATSQMQSVLGLAAAPTVPQLRTLFANALEYDFARPDSLYRDLLTDYRTADEAVQTVRTPATWDHQSSVLLPHVAADLFGLELGVLGELGHPEAVGQVSGLRRSNAGAPFLMVQLGGQFQAAQPVPGPPVAPPVLRTPFVPGALTPWTANLSADEQNLVNQAGDEAQLPPGEAEQAARLGTLALFGHLAAVPDAPAPVAIGAAETALTTRARTALLDWTGQGAQILGDFEALERISTLHDPAVNGALATQQQHLRDLHRRALHPGAAALTATEQADLDRSADLAALADQAPLYATTRADVTIPAPAGGIRATLQAALTRATVGGTVDPAAVDRELAGLNVAGLLHDLAEADSWEQLARANAPQVAAARNLEVNAVTAHLAPIQLRVRLAAEFGTEWRLRQNNAIDLIQAGQSQRYLPSGFGETVGVGGRTRYGLGRGGRYVRLGDTHLNDLAGLARQVAGSLPAATRAQWGVQAEHAVLEYLEEHGSRTFMDRIVHGTLSLNVGRGATAGKIDISLDLSNLDRAQQAAELHSERTVVGEAGHFAVEADHESTSGMGYTRGGSRGLSVAGNLLVAYGGLPNKVFNTQINMGISGSASTTHGFGADAVSATKRLLPLSGEKVYFDLPDAVLTVNVAGAPPTTAEPVRLTTRVSFPEELTPVKPAGAAELGALRDQSAARPVLHGSRRVGLNVTKAQIDADATGGLAARAARVAEAQHFFFNQIESAPDLADLQAGVHAELNAGGRTDAKLAGLVDYQLDEDSIVRNFGDVSGAGYTSPLLTGETRTGRVPGLKELRTAHLTVKGGLLKAQAVSIDEVPMKEESQRFVNFNDNTSQGANVSFTPISAKFGHNFGFVTAPIGGSSSISAQGDLTASLNSSRTISANSGSGHISGLVYNGRSVLYRATMLMEVEVAQNTTTAAVAPKVSREVEVYLRIPEHQRTRFEDMLDDMARLGGPIAAAYPQDTGDVPIDPSLTGDARTAEVERRRHEHAPQHLAAGKGIGFSAVSHLGGSEKVMPAIVDRIQQAGAAKAWSRRWDAMELAALRTRLASRYTREGLVNWGSALFQDTGVRMQVPRAAREGTELITVTVKGRLVDRRAIPTGAFGPKQSGRIHSTKLEIMPSAFAGAGGGDSMGSVLAASAQVGASGKLGLGDATIGPDGKSSYLGHRLRTLGGSIKYDYSRSVSETTNVNASGFMLEAILYDGPARYFDYDVEYDVHVEVEHKPDVEPMSWVNTLAQRATSVFKNGYVPLSGDPEVVRDGELRGTGEANTTIQGGEARFVMVEALARKTAITDVTTIGLTAVSTPDPPAAQGAHASRTVTVPDVRPHLHNGVHQPLTPDDQVMDVLSNQRFVDAVEGALNDVGLSREDYGNIPRMLVSNETLASSMVRGPSTIQQTFVGAGLYKDQVVELTVTGFPHNRVVEADPIPIFQMHVAEGNGGVSYSKNKTVANALNLSASFGSYDGDDGGGTQTSGTGYNYTFDLGTKSSGKGKSFTPTTGRLVQGTRNYRDTTADMLWQVTAVSHKKNAVHTSTPAVSHRLVNISKGLTYLTLETPFADPRAILDNAAAAASPAALAAAFPQPTAISGIPSVLNTVAAPAPGTVASPHLAGNTNLQTFAASRDNPTMQVPVVPLLPGVAVSERLLPIPAAPAAAGAGPAAYVPFDVTGDGNPVLGMVRDILAANAPDMLQSNWTLQAGDTARSRGVPAKLRNLLNVGSLEALVDLMLGPGLVLHGIRSLPLYNEQVQLVLRAKRDPNNAGYFFLESVDGTNVSTYTFRLNAESESSGDSKASSSGVGTGISESPADTGRFANFSGSPGISVSKSSSKGSSVTRTKAIRDTFFVGGKAARYGGEMEISVALRRTRVPSRVFNTLLVGLPRKFHGLINQHGVYDLPQETRRVTVMERVIVPEGALRPTGNRPVSDPASATPTVHGQTFAVQELPRGSRVQDDANAVPFNLRPEDLTDHDVVNFGFDQRKLQVLFDTAMRRFTGDVLPLDSQRDALHPFGGEQRSFAVSRLTDAGTRSRDAMHYLMSYQMFTRQLELMLPAGGLTLPTLIREGGAFTDNSGELTIEVELMNPQSRGTIEGWLESVDYAFKEFNENSGDSRGTSASLNLSTTEVSGENNPSLPANAHTKQKPADSINLSVGTSGGRSTAGVHKNMSQAFAKNIRADWERVTADAIIRLKFTARNTRDWIDLPGGEVNLAFRVNNAVELGLHPEAALRHAILDPAGMRVPSGVFVPAVPPAAGAVAGELYDDADSLRAAFAVPSLTGDSTVAGTATAFAVHARVTADGRFRAGHEILTAQEFHDQVLRDVALAPRQALVLIAGGDSATGGALRAARNLANVTNLRVFASDTQVHVTPDGAILAALRGPRNVAGLGPASWNTGRWVSIHPARLGVAEQTLSYDLFQALRAERIAVGVRPQRVPPPLGIVRR